MLFTADIDFQVGVAGVLADDHPLIDFNVMRHEQYPALLSSAEAEGRGNTRFACQEAAVTLDGHIAAIGDVTGKQGVQDARTAGLRQELVAEAQQAAGRHFEAHMHVAVAR